MREKPQQELLDELDGHSPKEQYEIIRKLADALPLWKELRKAKRKAAPAKQRKTG